MHMKIENIKAGLVKILALNLYSIKDIEHIYEFYTEAGYEVNIVYRS